MPSALFEIYQKNFEKTLKRLSDMLELYQKQSKEVQSITLKETELNISEMERAISQMELEISIEKIPDNKKKLNKIIENNKNIVKQYRREIQDLKFKEQSILNKKNLAYIPSSQKKKKIELNLLKNINNNEDEDTALFIDKNVGNNNINNYSFDEINLKTDIEIKRRKNNLYDDNTDGIISKINNTNDLDYSISNNKKIKKDNYNDKDSQDNKYKINKNNLFNNILRIIINIIHLIITLIVSFCKNVIYKRFMQFKNYLNNKYGYRNTLRILIVLAIICFIILYSLFVYIFSPSISNIENMKNNTNINLIKNNSIQNNTGLNLNENSNITSINIKENKTNVIIENNENNRTNDFNNITEKKNNETLKT